jgi:hypothetical protein
MARGTEDKCISMEVNSLIQVRLDTLMLKSVLETVGKVVERQESKMMTWVMGCKCSSMEINSLIQVRQDTLLHKSLSETQGKVIAKQG